MYWLLIIPCIIFLIIGTIVLAKDKTVIYRECPKCHDHKLINFSWLGLLLLIPSAVGIIIDIIYLFVKFWELKCDYCNCLTQKIVITHSNKECIYTKPKKHKA